MNLNRLQTLIREVADFPKPGIKFKDLNPIFADPDAFNFCIAELSTCFSLKDFDVIVAIEARGFIVGAALAAKTCKSFVPARKPGKLPSQTTRVSYDLEYGKDALEIQSAALKPGQRVLLVDDVLATGGTAAACRQLITNMQASVIGALFVAELSALGGNAALAPTPCRSLLAL